MKLGGHCCGFVPQGHATCDNHHGSVKDWVEIFEVRDDLLLDKAFISHVDGPGYQKQAEGLPGLLVQDKCGESSSDEASQHVGILMLLRLKFAPKPTDNGPEHQQEGTDEEAKLDGVLANEPLNNGLGRFDNLLNAKNSGDTSFDQITKHPSFGRGSPARADARPPMFAVRGPSELEAQLLGQSLRVVQVGEGDRGRRDCRGLLVWLDFGEDPYFDIGDLFQAQRVHGMNVGILI